MQVTAQKILIDRDIMTKIHKDVWPWEVPVYQEKFGEGRVRLLSKFSLEVNELPKAADEFGRLVKAFGIDSGDGGNRRPHVENAYGVSSRGGIKALEKAIKVSAKAKRKKPPVKQKDSVRKAA